VAGEVAVQTPKESGAFARRFRERVYVWRRLFLQNWNLFKASRIGVVGLAIMIAFVILALAAPFMGLRDPIRWTAPDEDLIEVTRFWYKDTTIPGSEFSDLPQVSQPLVFRVLPDSFEPRADRIYMAARNRLYALQAKPDLYGDNAWGILSYFDVTRGTSPSPSRTISAAPLNMNYGDYVDPVPDNELYLGTSDGRLFIIRDTTDYVPSGVNLVHEVQVDGTITGLAAFSGDMEAAKKVVGVSFIPAIYGAPHDVFWNASANGWTDERLESSGDDGEFASLAFDLQGRPLIAYYSIWAGVPRVQYRNDTLGWRLYSPSPPEPFSDTVNVGQYVSLKVGADGRPRMAYYEETERDLKYVDWNASAASWNPPTYLDYVNDTGQFASLALNASDLSRIAYYNETARSLMYVRQGNATTWSLPEVVDPGPGVGKYASLALNATGLARIAYYNETSRALVYVNETSPGVWSPPSVLDQGNDVGQFASLALDASGYAHIAYYDGTATALWYVREGPAGWSSPEVVDDTADVGRYASIAVNGTGPSIAYYDATNLDLKLASWTVALGWQNRTIVSQGHAGQYNSLQFDADDNPHIANYVFQTGRTTKDVVAVGTSTGKLYLIDVGIPGPIERVGNPPREKQVVRWDYRVRWVADLGSEVHLASAPLNGPGAVPLFSPAFREDGSMLFAGTAGGLLTANYTSNQTAAWPPISMGPSWSTAPIVERDSEGPNTTLNREIVYAASRKQTVDDTTTSDGETGRSFLYAVLADTGEPIAEWADSFEGLGGKAPIGPTLTTADGGDLSQPTVEGSVIYLGSTSGSLYAIRRDAVGEPGTPSYLPPASLKWDPNEDGVPEVYRDPSLLGLNPEFTSAPVVVSKKGILLAAANHDGGTPGNASDDRGVVYSVKLDVGNLSWKKTFLAPIAGSPISWMPPSSPISIDENVWVAYGGPLASGLAAYRTAGSFLAPSPPSWAHSYKCPTETDEDKMCPGYPSGNQYWLGLDSQGRDIFSQVIWGSRIALLVGFLSAFFTVVLGVVVGLVAGYVGGKVESVLMRFTDVILVLPGLPLIITLAAVLGASIWNIILVISLLGWPGIARIIRSEVLSLKERPFIDSARVTGASTTRIVFRHIAPNVMPLAFLYMTFAVSGAILTEAALSFIGLGDINTMSWGIMLQLVSQSRSLQAWWWLLPPGIAITLISLSFFLVGRAFDEIVNPRLRKR